MQIQRQVKNLNPQFYPAVLAQGFRQRMRRQLDFNNVRTFTEKLQWIKLYDATPIKSRLADKYLVRRWVADKIGAQYLIPLLGVWDDFDDTDFDELPDQFVLKCNHGSGMNIIVRDKSKFDMRAAREKIKFVCINGEIIYCQYLTDRSTQLKLNYFDVNWQPTTVERSDHPNSEHPENIPPPKNFTLMKKLAARSLKVLHLCASTFTKLTGAGNFRYKSEGTDEYLGKLLKLPAPTPPSQI
ncbi:MAG: hypothetical protein SR1Q7_04625 [Quinella sp. 1Q7]|nr:hypothetical protein [Quinella sp. 1Q7]